MKKVIVFVLAILSMTMSGFAFKSMPSDTNKVNAEGEKEGLWKEKINEIEYLGKYINGKREGLWIGEYPDGNDNRPRVWMDHHAGDLISNIDEYKNDKRNGLSITMDLKGYISKKDYYVNDTLDGVSIIYFPGAKLRSKTEYKMGKLNGISSTYYSADGRVKEEISYKNNIRDGASKWYYPKDILTLDNVKVSVEYQYKNGVLEGPQKTFYKSGNLESIVNSVNNLEEGEYHSYFENGKDKIIGKYVHGLKEGSWKEFDETGKIVKTEIYKNGELKK